MDIEWLDELVWDEQNIAHIARHDVEPEECEEVVFDPSTRVFRAKLYRLAFIGLTGASRFLTIIVARYDATKARVITARDSSDKEKRLFKEGT